MADNAGTQLVLAEQLNPLGLFQALGADTPDNPRQLQVDGVPRPRVILMGADHGAVAAAWAAAPQEMALRSQRLWTFLTTCTAGSIPQEPLSAMEAFEVMELVINHSSPDHHSILTRPVDHLLSKQLAEHLKSGTLNVRDGPCMERICALACRLDAPHCAAGSALRALLQRMESSVAGLCAVGVQDVINQLLPPAGPLAGYMQSAQASTQQWLVQQLCSWLSNRAQRFCSSSTDTWDRAQLDACSSLLRLYEHGLIAGLPNSHDRLQGLCELFLRASPTTGRNRWLKLFELLLSMALRVREALDNGIPAVTIITSVLRRMAANVKLANTCNQVDVLLPFITGAQAAEATRLLLSVPELLSWAVSAIKRYDFHNASSANIVPRYVEAGRAIIVLEQLQGAAAGTDVGACLRAALVDMQARAEQWLSSQATHISDPSAGRILSSLYSHSPAAEVQRMREAVQSRMKRCRTVEHGAAFGCEACGVMMLVEHEDKGEIDAVMPRVHGGGYDSSDSDADDDAPITCPMQSASHGRSPPRLTLLKRYLPGDPQQDAGSAKRARCIGECEEVTSWLAAKSPSRSAVPANRRVARWVCGGACKFSCRLEMLCSKAGALPVSLRAGAPCALCCAAPFEE